MRDAMFCSHLAKSRANCPRALMCSVSVSGTVAGQVGRECQPHDLEFPKQDCFVVGCSVAGSMSAL